MGTPTLVGGQAVIEGVMMRHKNRVAVVCRDQKGKYVSTVKHIKPTKSRFLKLPFVRGVYALLSSLSVGIWALSWSAQVAEGKNEKFSKTELVVTFIVSLLLSLSIFVALPLFLSKFVFSAEGFALHALDGALRVALFVGYILLIMQMKDVRRLFQYHGAEHKAVYCYENGKPLVVKETKKFSRLHPRCGTTFVVFLLLIMILLHSLLVFDNFWLQFGGRLLMLPIIVGISYEVLFLVAKRINLSGSWFSRSLCKIGFLFQRLTTKEPDDAMVGCALKALSLAVGLSFGFGGQDAAARFLEKLRGDISHHG